MATITNLGRVQGGGFFGTTSTNTISIAKTTVQTNGVSPLVGDTIVNANGDLCKITAIGTSTYTVSKYSSIKGATGSQGISYGTCPTPSNKEIKNVAMPSIPLEMGTIIFVNFTFANTFSSPRIKINDSGDDLPISYLNSSENLQWKNNETLILLYMELSWIIIGGYSLSDKPVGKRWIQFEGEETPAAQFGGTWTIDTDYANKALVASADENQLGNSSVVGTKHSHDLAAGYAKITRRGTSGWAYITQKSTPTWVPSKYSDSNAESFKDFTESWGIDVATALGGTTNNVSSGLPPYKIIAIWKRTA